MDQSGHRVMAPTPLFGGRGGPMTPEKRLMLAVLEDAIQYLRKYRFAGRVRDRRLLHETQEWLDCRDKVETFSFENICEILDVDPGCVRRSLQRWARNKWRESYRGSLLGQSHECGSIGNRVTYERRHRMARDPRTADGPQKQRAK